MLDKMKQVEEGYEELCARAEQTDFYADPKKAAAWLREQKELAPIVAAYRAYCAAQRDMQDAAELMAGQADAELKALCQEELTGAKKRAAALEQELRVLLLPHDPNDGKNVILEIRPGVGGEESALFAHSLYRMYTMYAEAKHWTVTLLNYNETELGGVKEADFESTFREYAERGYDIIMAAGSQFDEAASSVAANYPNTRFMVVNGSKCDADNLCPLFPKEYEASYLAAVIAGHITANGQFGLIGGDPNQAMKDLMAVYGKTAVSIAKDRGIADASYNLAYSNSWTDVALGKQMSENMIDNGADVMFVYANELGLGVINGAVEKGAKVVGYSSDQTTIDPKTVVASIDFDYATSSWPASWPVTRS